MTRLAVLSMHTSPSAQPGTGDGGGMNVYVRELAASLARLGADVDVFTRAESADARAVVDVEPGVRVHHIEAGPLAPVDKDELVAHVGAFTDGVLCVMARAPERYDAVHANYWLSGMAGHAIKHELDLPLLVTFHTAERIKAQTSGEPLTSRADVEAQIVACADAVLASCAVEACQLTAQMDVDPARIAVVPLGVDHAIFGPGDRRQARRAIGVDDDGPLLLFAGRLQALKGPDLALETLAELAARGGRHRLVVVGGPSGRHGDDFVAGLHDRAERDDLDGRVRFVAPKSHELLSTYYRAADACLVPSTAETFGLVALEAQSCGTPVVASHVGGLASLVADGTSGVLVADRTARAWADAVELVTDDDRRAARLSSNAALSAQRYTWRAAAARFDAVVAEVRASRLVTCA